MVPSAEIRGTPRKARNPRTAPPLRKGPPHPLKLNPPSPHPLRGFGQLTRARGRGSMGGPPRSGLTISGRLTRSGLAAIPGSWRPSGSSLRSTLATTRRPSSTAHGGMPTSAGRPASGRPSTSPRPQHGSANSAGKTNTYLPCGRKARRNVATVAHSSKPHSA